MTFGNFICQMKGATEIFMVNQEMSFQTKQSMAMPSKWFKTKTRFTRFNFLVFWQVICLLQHCSHCHGENDVRTLVKNTSSRILLRFAQVITARVCRCAGFKNTRNQAWISQNRKMTLATSVWLSVFCLEFNMKELLLFVCLTIGHSFGISEQKVVKSGRLFSNPFGILGHEACPTTLKGRNVTGICYNEMECLLR